MVCLDKIEGKSILRSLNILERKAQENENWDFDFFEDFFEDFEPSF